MELFAFVGSYVHDLFWSWVGIALGLLGLNELSQWLLRRSFGWLHQHRVKVAVAVLIVAQAQAYRQLKRDYDELGHAKGFALSQRYSLGGSSDVLQARGIPENRWIPIPNFRVATIEWLPNREATVQGSVVFPVVGHAGSVRMRLVRMPNLEPVAFTDWIERREPDFLKDEYGVEMPFRFAVPRESRTTEYRLEVTTKDSQSVVVVTAEVVYSPIR